LAASLRHAITTASNDDYSQPRTPERQRHADRLVAMQNAADFLETLAND